MGSSASHRRLHKYGDAARWRCYHCGCRCHCQTCYPAQPKGSAATRDHLIPRSKGGKGGANLVLSCDSCNRKKADRHVGELPPPKKAKTGCRPSARRNPRKPLPTEALAFAMCEAVRQQFGTELVPYMCDKCGQWHIRAAADTH